MPRPWRALLLFLNALSWLCPVDSIAQTRRLRGTVMDNRTQLPVPNASILVKDSQLGTTSDSLGRFTLDFPQGANTITVSSVDYQGRDVIPGTREQLLVYLNPAENLLQQVVVVGYGTARKKDLTGAIGSLKEKDFNKGVFASPDLLFQGRLAGVQVFNNSGQPGGSSTIRIRGNSALYGYGQPLFVVDGIPLDGRSLQPGTNPLNFINPDDIESIDILKDASATAIYGSRAAFGVVILNTKKGREGPPMVSLDASVGVSSMLRNIDVLNASQYRDAIRYYDVSPDGDKGSEANAMDQITREGLVQQYALSVQGGGENAQYRISGSLLNQDGIIINTGLKKYGMDMGTRFRFTQLPQLSLNINLNANQYIQDFLPPATNSAGTVVAALSWNPTSPLRNPDGSFNFSNGISSNPLATAELSKNSLKVTTVLASIAPSFRITPWLEYKLLLSANYSTGISRASVDQALRYPFDPRGTANVGNNELLTKQVSNTLNARKSFGNGFGIDGLIGYDYMSFSYKGFSAAGTGVQGIGFGNFGLDYSNYIQYSGTLDRSIASFADPVSELQSFFARVSLDYKGRYLLTATVRADGSTKFGENNKYGVFPSLAASWVISEEKFFSSKTIQLLKLRAGWGITGNQEFPAGSSQAKYSFRDNGSIIQVNAPNPDLQWQQDKQLNLGIDFRLWEGRLYGSIDLFSKKTTRLLFPSPPIQPSPPQAVIRWINLEGTIANKGLELGLNGSIVQQDHFTLDLHANLTFLHNTVSGIPSPIPTGYLSGSGVSGVTVQVIQDGSPMNTFFTRRFTGIDPGTGLSTYEDDGNTLYTVGNPNPSTLLGFGLSARFGQFSAGIDFYGAFGQDVFLNTFLNVVSVNSMATQQNIARLFYEEPVKESPTNATTPSSRFIYEGNYLKLSNLTLGYDLGKLLKTFRNSSLYLTGQNLFLFTKYPGFDPESNVDAGNNGIPSLGIDYAQYPSSRIIRVGIKLGIQ